MMKSLDQAPVGSYASIVRLHGRGATKGEQVYVRKVAPLGDPVEITVRGYELSLRKADAAMVEIAGS